MQASEKVAKLRELCKELDRLEQQIEELLGIVSARNRIKHPRPDQEKAEKEAIPKRKGCAECGAPGRHFAICSLAKSKGKDYSASDHGKRKYQCKICDHVFVSTLPKIDVVCPECGSLKIDFDV